MYATFIDLDELTVRCREKSSRKFIQEAISCYRAGAFRSCIVATWNAVVFDFLHKLRELELFGDREAEGLLEKFDSLRSSGKQYKELWQFESSIPEIALTKFELISNVEKLDIERLFEDRSRCAHPSMTSLEEPFEATAELARYHLRSAVTHLLERPPVQGRAARQRIFEDIKSEYFPVEPKLAIKYFQKSPLARARFTLIKDIIIGLTKGLLIEDYPEDERARLFSALNAVAIMYPQQAREILNNQLSEIIISRVKDENWDKVIIYLGSIEAWDNLSNPCRLKAEAYINQIDIFETFQKFYKRLSPQTIHILVKASHIFFLREAVTNKLHIPLKDLLSLRETCKDNLFREKVLIPLLRKLSSQANLKELILISSETLLKSDETIQTYIKEKIQDSSLKKLVLTLSNNQKEQWLIDLIELNLEEKIPKADLDSLLATKSRYEVIDNPKDKLIKLLKESITKQVKTEIEATSLEETVFLITKYEDIFFIDLIDSDLEKKITNANLEDLLAARSEYKFLDEPKAQILESFDRSIAQQLNTISFDNLLKQRINSSEIPDELLKPILKKNAPAIIDKFAKSGSFDSAGSNTKLLIKIAEYLSPAQWESILEAFFENNQLYCSYSCIEQFELLFKKSIEVSSSGKSHWETFREKLDKYNDKYINSLKRLIDSHL